MRRGAPGLSPSAWIGRFPVADVPLGHTSAPLYNGNHEQGEQERQQGLQAPLERDTKPRRRDTEADRCDQIPLDQRLQRPVPPLDLRQEDQVRGRSASSLTEAARRELNTRIPMQASKICP